MKRSVRADSEKNILYLKFSGFHQAEDAHENIAAILREVPKLQPGFAVINDISDFDVADLEAQEILKQGMAHLQSIGCRRVIRVVSRTLAMHQFSSASQDVGYKADLALSVAEAERMLAEGA